MRDQYDCFTSCTTLYRIYEKKSANIPLKNIYQNKLHENRWEQVFLHDFTNCKRNFLRFSSGSLMLCKPKTKPRWRLQLKKMFLLLHKINILNWSMGSQTDLHSVILITAHTTQRKLLQTTHITEAIMGTAALGTHGFLDAAFFTIPAISVPGCFYLENGRNYKSNII